MSRRKLVDGRAGWMVRIRVARDERASIQAQAAADRMTLGDWIAMQATRAAMRGSAGNEAASKAMPPSR